MPTRRQVVSATAVAFAPFVSAPSPAHAQATAPFVIKVLGDPTAPVEIREYSSLTCPHCARWHAETLPELKSSYIDTGKAKLVFRDFPLNLQSWLAAAVAHCAGPERFFDFLQVLFEEQPRWAAAPTTRAARSRLETSGLPQMWIDAGRNAQEVESLLSVSGSINALVDLAKLGGQPETATLGCLANFELLDWILEAQQEGRETFDVQATPTIVVAGKPLEGARSAAELAREIDAVLAGG